MAEIFFAGGPVMYPLLLCSIITLAIIIDRTLFWLRYRNGARPELIAELCNSVRGGSWSRPDDTDADLIARVLIKGLESPPAKAYWCMQQAAAKEAELVSSYLVVLSTMVSLAPLLGIFGTVLGIIESFQLLGDSALIDPVAASGGLAQALITTAFGLGVAMPSLIAYKVFALKSSKLRYELEARCTELELSLGLEASAKPL